MSFNERKTLTKDNLDFYLKEVAKEYRRINGKCMPAEIILVGGAAILANYGFRDMTTDVDAWVQAASSMKDAINRVGDKYGLPNHWLNSDFKRTTSFTPRIMNYSRHYRTFYNVVEVRTIDAEYLIAMKLKSGRQYKNDLSDIAGILSEHEKDGKPILMGDIDRAVHELYDDWRNIPNTSVDYIHNLMDFGHYEIVYAERKIKEVSVKEELNNFEQNYPSAINQDNIDDIISLLERNIPSK